MSHLLSGTRPNAGVKFGGTAPKCIKCQKSVYSEEMVKSGTEDMAGNACHWHKACYKCEVCNTSLDLASGAPDRDHVYCKTHYRELHVARSRNADGTQPVFTAKPAPAASHGARVEVKTSNPSCAKCGKAVYKEEEMRSGASDENDHPCTYHRECFKCETCGCSLDHTTCTPDRKVLYCRAHYTEIHVQGRRTDDEIAAGTSKAGFAAKPGASKAAFTIATTAPKCQKCQKSVYAEEMARSGASDPAGNPYCYHKACFRCETCNCSLDTNSVAPDRASIFCKQHYREIHVERRRTDQEIAEGKEGKRGDFKAIQGAGKAADLGLVSKNPNCTKCGKVVYKEEEMRSGTEDEAGKPCVYHRACFRCATCDASLTLDSVAPDRTTLYCIHHYREIHIALKRSDQEIADNKFAVTFTAKPGAGGPSGVTVTTKDPNCTKCGKIVYASDLIRSGATDENGVQCSFHKACFRCETCGTGLELTNCAPDGKLIYCQPHYYEIHVNKHGETGALAASKPSASS